MSAILQPEALQILKDVQRFGAVRRYHGLLPEKYALLYDETVLKELLDQALLEQAVVLSRCGSKLRGYRLTDRATDALRDAGMGPREPALSRPFRELGDENLACEDLQALADAQHCAHIRRNGGLCPKDDLYDDHGKKRIKRLYEMGLLLYIKLKDAKGKDRKGYVLSELGRRVLASAGEAVD